MKSLSDEFKETVEAIKEDICDNFCKYPSQYSNMCRKGMKSLDDLKNEICNEYCPLNKL